MKVGIPKSLLYYKYYPFIETFFIELGAEIVLSKSTNKEILNNGVKFCVDEACL
ncbi:MAG: acyl-CoA dehydratase activase-related protein, partial [Bacillota bacterium]|nr:acyl-CoA dehydratase activase-related protein [Bacillota bacterium]